MLLAYIALLFQKGKQVQNTSFLFDNIVHHVIRFDFF